MNASNTWFDPGRMPPRDEDGWCSHPDLDLVLEGEGPELDERPISDAKVNAAGFEIRFNRMFDEVDEAAMDRYMEEGTMDISGWEPASPGPEWQLVGIWDTEDGPAAAFVRPLLGGADE